MGGILPVHATGANALALSSESSAAGVDALALGSLDGAVDATDAPFLALGRGLGVLATVSAPSVAVGMLADFLVLAF
jgi:hypothetical protein